MIDAGIEVIHQDDRSVAEAAHQADALVCHLTDRIDQSVFQRNPQLRLVSNVATGSDNIDLDAARNAGVIVTNTPDVLVDATADLTLALLLAVARRIPESDALVRSEGRVDWSLEQEPMGVAVAGRTLGIIGMGRIGSAVARRAIRGFGMRVLFTGGSGASAHETLDLGAAEVSLTKLLTEADFVSLHAPLTETSRHIINAKTLATMKRSAILINTARGPLIDENALACALDDGVILGAGLDVFEDEPEVHPELLVLRERVVLTSHIGSATENTRRAMSDMAVDNVLAFASGRPVPNPVASASSE